MRLNAPLCRLLGSLLLGPLALRAAPVSEAKVDALVEKHLKSVGLVGVSVTVLQDGKVALAKGYGQANLATGAKVQPDTVFAIGSVTKEFTCAAILLLAEDGRLSVRDPVAKYLPDLTEAGRITLLDLMNHVSGYPDYYPLDFVDERMSRPSSNLEVIRRYATGKLDFEPGTRWSYSNTGYLILGEVIERVSGMPFAEFLKQRIFDPLGMDHSRVAEGAFGPGMAQGYAAFALGAQQPAGPEGRGWLGGAGAIRSTPLDLAKWDLALMDGKLLKPESWALMTTGRELPGGRSTDYGCGLAISRRQGRTILAHSGAVSGFFAQNALAPSSRSAVIVLSNCERGIGGLKNQILDLLLEDPVTLPTVSGPPAAEAASRFLRELQNGKIDRNRLGAAYARFLGADETAAAARRLKPLGRPRKTEVIGSHERGGMEVTETRFTFKSTTLVALMYRTPDGIIQEYLINKE